MRKLRRSERGQVSLEVGFALGAAIVLVIGAAIIFAYMSARMVVREEKYESDAESGRLAAASPYNDEEIVVDEEEQLPKLDIFGTAE